MWAHTLAKDGTDQLANAAWCATTRCMLTGHRLALGADEDQRHSGRGPPQGASAMLQIEATTDTSVVCCPCEDAPRW